MSSQGTSLICAVGLGLVTALISEVAAQTGLQDPPALSQRPAAIACSFTGPLVHVPSKSAGTEGLLVRISPPARGRYPQGAPIAVHMIASRPNVAGSRACLSERGFVDVGFLCPGGEYRDAGGALWRSGGAVVNQASAQQRVEPLGDVLSFATGNLRSTEGKSIQDYVPGVRAMTENAGIIGWSFGGNLSVLAMARYSDRFPNLKWYASWETPILGPVDDGRGTFYEPNPFYNPQTDEIDFTRLRYSHNMPVWVWPVIGLGPQPDWPRGGLFLDGDGNGQFSRPEVPPTSGSRIRIAGTPRCGIRRSEARQRSRTGERLARGSRAMGSLQSRHPLPCSGDGENARTAGSISRDEGDRPQEHRRSARTGSRARRAHRWSGHVRRGVRARGPHAIEYLDAYLKPRSGSVNGARSSPFYSTGAAQQRAGAGGAGEVKDAAAQRETLAP
jgi:hypothetical protein